MKTMIGSILLLLLSCTTSPSLASPIPDQQDTETPTIKTRRLLLRGGDRQQHDEHQARHLAYPDPVDPGSVGSEPQPAHCDFAGYSKWDYDGTGTRHYRLYSTTFAKNVRGSERATVGLSHNAKEWEEWVLESANSNDAAPYRIRNLYHGYYLKAQPGGENGEVSVACADNLSGLTWDVEFDNNGKVKIRSVKWGTYLRPMDDDSINQTTNANDYRNTWVLNYLGEL